MGRVLWHTTMSLDGFIAGPGDDTGWLARHAGPNPTASKVIGQIGAVLMGRRTYRAPADGDPRVYGEAWNGPQFVLTHDDPSTAAPGFTFVGGDIADALSTARSAAGDKYVSVLGANAAHACLEAGLLDEILVHVAPLLLGDGTRLFDHPGGAGIALEQLSVTHTPAVTDIWLRVV